MVFHALTFARSHGRCWKPRLKAAVFNTSQGTWRMLMHWKIMFDRYYCMKTENLLHYALFLALLCFAFSPILANEMSTDYAPSRAGKYMYTSRNGSKSVAPVRPYWKLRSRALTARELPYCLGFSPVNARLLITCGTAFYAIISNKNSSRFLCCSSSLFLRRKFVRCRLYERPVVTFQLH